MHQLVVGPTGSVLIGRAGGLAPAAQMREEFTTWRLALALEEDREHPMSGGTIWLHAAARQGGQGPAHSDGLRRLRSGVTRLTSGRLRLVMVPGGRPAVLLVS